MGEAGNNCLLPASEAPNGESQPRGLGTAAGERVTRAGVEDGFQGLYLLICSLAQAAVPHTKRRRISFAEFRS